MARPRKPDTDRRADHAVRAYLTGREVERLDRRRGSSSRSGYLVAESGLSAPCDLRGLTVQQPWASAIIRAGKTIENRKRDPGVRSGGQWVAIHAGKATHALAEECYRLAPQLRGPLTMGAIIGIAWIDRVDPYESHAHDRWAVNCGDKSVCLVITDVRELTDPIPCRGWMGLWRVPVERVSQIEKVVGVLG